MKNKKVLVIGGCGYIGGYITDLINSNNLDVTIYE
jgi:nucleoside-diphosphate-sugar epimerase